MMRVSSGRAARAVAAAGLAVAALLPGPAGAAAHVSAAARASGPAGIALPLHTSGASIVDASGRPVRLSLVSWYGAESPDYVVGGLAYRPVREIIGQIVALGFNGVRLPWSNQMWESDPKVAARYVAANPQFAGERARTIFEQVVSDLAAAGLMVVLDNHNSDAEWCCSFTDGNTLWYNRAYPQPAWLADWTSAARAFRGIPQVIGADLRNEPRGLATWGGPHPADDWHAAAQRGGNAILAVDGRWLIFVEGTVGGIDLYGVPRLPVRLKRPGRVVYSMHDYGFDHFGLTDYDGWATQVRSEWGRLAGKYPLWLGEFGTCNTAAGCVTDTGSGSGSGAANGRWFSFITRFLRYHDVSWSYWPVNGTQSDGLPGQGRTYGAPESYGLLNTSWAAPELPALTQSLRPVQAACPAGPVASGTYYITSRSSGDVVAIPHGSTTEGTSLEQLPRDNSAGQRWRVTALGCGLYSVISAEDHQSADVRGQSVRPGGGIDQWDYRGIGSQQFVISRAAPGYATITNLNSMDAIQDPGSSPVAGTPLDQWPGTGAADQQWSFSS